MLKLVVDVVLFGAIGSILVLGGAGVGVKTSSGEAKSSAFECGLLAYDNGRSAFSIQFFLVSLVFLIFDVELVLLFPYIKGAGSEMLLIVFISVLTGGLIVEWLQEMLDWYK